MRLPRMTTRRWMVAILAVGLTMAATVKLIRLSQAAQRYRLRAQEYSAIAIMWKRHHTGFRNEADRWRKAGHQELAELYEFVRSNGEAAESCARGWQEKYEYAASHPWIGEPRRAPGTYVDQPSSLRDESGISWGEGVSSFRGHDCRCLIHNHVDSPI